MEVKGLASITKAYEALLSEKPGIFAFEATWLSNAREMSANRWRSEGLPTRRLERWKYTSLASVEDSRVVVPSSVTRTSSLESLFPGGASAEIAVVNGRFEPALSKVSSQSGLKVRVLSDLLKEKESEQLAVFRKFLEAHLKDETVVAAINTSFMQDAVLVEVGAGTRISEPVVIRYLAKSDSPQAGELPMACPRVFVQVGKSAELAIVEAYSGNEDQSLVNSVTDISLADGARVNHCRIQMESGKTVHIGTTRIHQKAHSFSESCQFAFGGRIAREELYVKLEGEGAEAIFDGLYCARDQQHIDNYTVVEHAVPHTTSQQIYKGIIDGEARAVFNGHVRIHRDAQKSNASQLNKNLMLSRKAEIDTRPELEIDADDVKAAHGATIGQIDPEQIYYLRSRGISEKEAIKMLSRGFAQEVVFKMGHESIRSLMRGLVDEKLATLGGSHA